MLPPPISSGHSTSVMAFMCLTVAWLRLRAVTPPWSCPLQRLGWRVEGRGQGWGRGCRCDRERWKCEGEGMT